MAPTPLLLLPGLLCDAALWRGQAGALADIADVHVADLSRDDSIAAMADRVLAAAPPRFALAGLSMGGYVAFEVMRRASDRVTRLALFDTSAGPDTPERSAGRREAVRVARDGGFDTVVRDLLGKLLAPGHRDGPIAATVLEMAHRLGPEVFARQQEAIIGRIDSRPHLAAIRVPTLVAVGALDPITPPAELEVIHRGVAGSSWHVLPGAAHLPPLETPDAVSALLRAWIAG